MKIRKEENQLDIDTHLLKAWENFYSGFVFGNVPFRM